VKSSELDRKRTAPQKYRGRERGILNPSRSLSLRSSRIFTALRAQQGYEGEDPLSDKTGWSEGKFFSEADTG